LQLTSDLRIGAGFARAFYLARLQLNFGVIRQQSSMTDTAKVELEFAVDTPDSMTFAELYEGLGDIWYRFSADAAGNVELWANRQGFEYLGRFFLKLARTPKMSGYHDHSTLEFTRGPSTSQAELTIGIVDERPPGV
jgi:hypothetical protein